MPKFFSAWLILSMLFLVACSSEAIASPNISPTTPPTRVFFVSTPNPSPSASPTLLPSPTLLTGILLTPSEETPNPSPTRDNEIYLVSQRFFSALSLLPQTHPQMVNGLDISEFVIMPANVVANIREIYTDGQSLGRNPRAFSRAGDSTIERPTFLYRFDEGEYNLGAYTYLQDMIDYYAGSFGHDSAAVRRGLHTWSVLDPMWAGGDCEAGENMLVCEIRLQNPSIFIIRLGSNDRGVDDLTEESLREIVEYCIENGVIPILGTKADRFEGSNNTNEVIRALATEYEVPLWDFDIVAASLQDRGLGRDNVHLTFFYEHDWRLSKGFNTGHGLHNLTALIMLDAVWQVLADER